MQYNRKVCRCELYASGTAFGDIVSLDTVISSYTKSHSLSKNARVISSCTEHAKAPLCSPHPPDVHFR